MKRYLVEVRLSYDVRADTADEALRLVSPAISRWTRRSLSNTPCVNAMKPAPQTDPKSPELHGLTKPVYTVTEAASVLGTSRNFRIRAGEAQRFQYATGTEGSYPKKYACRVLEWRTSAEGGIRPRPPLRQVGRCDVSR